MDIVITGNCNIDRKKYNVHKVLKKEYTLYVGTHCNDGRPITESRRYKEALKLGIPIVHPVPYVAKEMLITKYSPKSVKDIIGHKEQINQIATWLHNWNSKNPALIVTGPPGIGKTSTVHIIIKSLGYNVYEYTNRSILSDLISVGNKRLVKEVIVIDEIDGILGEIASTIKKSTTPIICIANDRTKVKPIINVCVDVKFNRPVASTIASALLKIAKDENIKITHSELESLCIRNGNDIRAILNILEFYGVSGDKDSQYDLFSATQKLLGNKLSMDDANDLVFSDYNMVPLMVQESYINASRTLEEACIASDFISDGDLIDKREKETNDWTLLPCYTQCTVSASKSVGSSTYVSFSSWLGKNSKMLKNQRIIRDFSRFSNFRLDYADHLLYILLHPLQKDAIKDSIKNANKKMDEMHITCENITWDNITRDNITRENITRDDIDSLQEILMEKILIEKIETPKTSFTRKYNKIHTKVA